MQNGDKIQYKALNPIANYPKVDSWIDGTYIAPHPKDKAMSIVLTDKNVLLMKLNTGIRIKPKEKKKMVGWVNIYSNGKSKVTGCVHDSKAAAERSKGPCIYLATVKITWEEEEE